MVRANQPLREIAANLANRVMGEEHLLSAIDRVFSHYYGCESSRPDISDLAQVGRGQVHAVHRVGELGAVPLVVRVSYQFPKLVDSALFTSELGAFDVAYEMGANVAVPLVAVAWSGLVKDQLFTCGGILCRDLTDGGRTRVADHFHDRVSSSPGPEYMQRFEDGRWTDWFVDPVTSMSICENGRVLASPEYRLDVVSELMSSNDTSRYF